MKAQEEVLAGLQESLTDVEASIRARAGDEAEHSAFKENMAKYRAHAWHIRLILAGSRRPRFGS